MKTLLIILLSVAGGALSLWLSFKLVEVLREIKELVVAAAREAVVAYERRQAKERRERKEAVAQYLKLLREDFFAFILGSIAMLFVHLLMWSLFAPFRLLERLCVGTLRVLFASNKAEADAAKTRLLVRGAVSLLSVGVLDDVVEIVGGDTIGDTLDLGGVGLEEGANDVGTLSEPFGGAEHADPDGYGLPSAHDGDPRVNEVHGHYRDDGTWIDGYWRGDPDDD
jgi:hypothetical protein